MAYKDESGYHTLYTVSHIVNDKLSLTSHGSEDCENTICGKDITTGTWYITNNTFDGIINCKKCIRRLKREERTQKIKDR